jgi:hypothetical protein
MHGEEENYSHRNVWQPDLNGGHHAGDQGIDGIIILKFF